MRWFSKRRGDARARRSRPTGSVARGTAPARSVNAIARDRRAAEAREPPRAARRVPAPPGHVTSQMRIIRQHAI